MRPNWSPDGTRIAFDVSGGSIYVMNADGTGATEARSDGYKPDWQRLPPAPVGGFMEPVNKLVVLAPWLAVIGVVGCIATVAVVSKKRHA